MKTNLIALFLILSLLNSINSLAQNPAQDILLFKDKDGLYVYNSSTATKKLLFKANEKQVFLDEPYKLSNDIVTFGFTGIVTHTISGYNSIEKYYKEYYSVDMKMGKSWPSGKILYSVLDDKLTIKTLSISPKGDTTVVKDSTTTLYSSYSNTHGVTYNNPRLPFFSENKVGEKAVFSKKGNIYYVDKKDTSLLIKYDKYFDPKLGRGYFEPLIAPSGDYVIFKYLPGTAFIGEDKTLQKIDLKTKKISVIKKGEFKDMSFSSDGNFLLFERHEIEEKSAYTLVYGVYILNLSNLQEKKVGKANFAKWLR